MISGRMKEQLVLNLKRQMHNSRRPTGGAEKVRESAREHGTRLARSQGRTRIGGASGGPSIPLC